MGDSGAVDSLLQAPGEVLDRIVAQLSTVGVDIPPLGLQFFLLVLIAALLIPTTKRLRARKKTDRVPLIAVAALGLLALGVVIGVIDNATTLSRVSGSLQAEDLPNLRLKLLDYRGRVISSDTGTVDTVTGHFVLHYSPFVDGRARKLRITSEGCRLQEIELSRAQLRAGAEQEWSFQCIRG